MGLQQLLESANPYQSVQTAAQKLAAKWGKTGLLEGLENEHKNNMAMILENQAKQLVVEASQTGGGATSAATFTAGQGEQWMGVALPLVRKVFGQISAKEFVSVQPMNLPSGLVFYLDFQYGNTKGGITAGDSVYGAAGTGNGPFGNTNSGALYGAGRFAYTTNNTGSTATVTTGSAVWADLNFDSNYSASAAAGQYKTVSVPTSSLPNLDVNGVRAFALPSNIQENVFTKIIGGNLRFIVSGSVVPEQGASAVVTYQLQPTDQFRGDFEDGNTGLNAGNSAIAIPEINIKMKSSSITAKTKKLKAVWTPEFAQDINAYHSIDAEAEITAILSEYISLEIDLEVLDMLMQNASAGTEYWSAVNNQGINAGATAFDQSLGFYNSQGQWFQTLGTKIQKLSNIIHQKTLRGGANFLICSPSVSTILESIPGFAADVNGDTEKANYAFGVQKIGSMNGRYKVFKNPYMIENQILLGFRGAQFLETGAVFAPYVPIIMTPMVYDPDTFTPRKGLLTRYAKKMVRSEYYGTIKVAGLNTL